jgi:CRISPR-associated endonuclease/helicase Cas3
MEFENYKGFFRQATKLADEPYAYQENLAVSGLLPDLLDVPTGMGKTAAVILAWLWKRFHSASDVPRRLVWCLPMRVLVEQTRQCVEDWLKNLDLQQHVKVHVMMGGEDVEDWDVHPEQTAILIGTQDMLISRALNRGYGMSRYRWPMHFGLLNNDCLWVLDEVQLMGAGLATTAQLHAFRKSLGTFGDSRSLWMSATLNPQWLRVVDLKADDLGEPLRLTKADKHRSKTYKAIKPLSRAAAVMDDAGALADEVLAAHRPASRTLVVVNTVARAVKLDEEIRKRAEKRTPELRPVLIHSRFRPPDRAGKVQHLLADPPPEGTIVVSTQVVEAGVDVSARVLFTELAPWASLVQRFGRCNRRGECDDSSPAQVFWIDLPDEAKHHEKLVVPYEPESLSASKRLLQQCTDGVGPETLDELDVKLKHRRTHVIRRKDLIELFDTTPDLAGNDIDIDRYVRDVDSSDVHVFWRDLQRPLAVDERMPQRHEICPAPIGDFKTFVGKLSKTEELRKLGISTPFRRNFLERRWEPVRVGEIYPGQAYMLASKAGGYDAESGWTGKAASKTHGNVAPIPHQPQRIGADDGNDTEPYSQIGVWQELSKHSTEALEELEQIATDLPHLNDFRKPLLTAIRWHDLGKAHWVFRHALPDLGDRDPFVPWAKAPRKGWKRYARKHFRHELASALAVLQESDGQIPEPHRDLIAYLVAAHHGKVRLSIRSLPGENKPGDLQVRFARGVWDGDPLPETDLGDGVVAPAVTLSLEPMELGLSADGQPSWAERMLALRDDPDLGPFRLAYLESLLRAADMRVSARIARDET